MRSSLRLTAAVLVASAAAFTLGRYESARPSRAAAIASVQPEGGMDLELMERMMRSMQPGEHHRALDVLLGTWEGSVSFWMAPDTEPMVSAGTVTREWAMDGRFIVEHVDADGMAPGERFKGMGIVGYNTIENRYESAWIENMATWISTANGSYDASSKTFTFEGDMLNPMTGQREWMRHVLDVSDPRREVMVGWSRTPDGRKFKNFEGDFKRTD
jgi:hypothetical protein